MTNLGQEKEDLISRSENNNLEDAVIGGSGASSSFDSCQNDSCEESNPSMSSKTAEKNEVLNDSSCYHDDSCKDTHHSLKKNEAENDIRIIDSCNESAKNCENSQAVNNLNHVEATETDEKINSIHSEERNRLENSNCLIDSKHDSLEDDDERIVLTASSSSSCHGDSWEHSQSHDSCSRKNSLETTVVDARGLHAFSQASTNFQSSGVNGGSLPIHKPRPARPPRMRDHDNSPPSLADNPQSTTAVETAAEYRIESRSTSATPHDAVGKFHIGAAAGCDDGSSQYYNLCHSPPPPPLPPHKPQLLTAQSVSSAAGSAEDLPTIPKRRPYISSPDSPTCQKSKAKFLNEHQQVGCKIGPSLSTEVNCSLKTDFSNRLGMSSSSSCACCHGDDVLPNRCMFGMQPTCNGGSHCCPGSEAQSRCVSRSSGTSTLNPRNALVNQSYRKKYLMRQRRKGSACFCKQSEGEQPGDEVVIMYSRHCSGSIEWAKYLHKVFCKIWKQKANLVVRHLPLEDITANLPHHMKTRIYTARLQLVILSPLFLSWLERQADQLVGRLLQQERVIAILLGVKKEQITPEHRTSLISYPQWVHLEAKDHDLDFVQTVLYHSSQIFQRTEAKEFAMAETCFFSIFPRKVTEGQNRVALLLERPVSPHSAVTVTIDKGGHTIPVEDVKLKNVYCLLVTLPVCLMAKSCLVNLHLNIDGDAKGYRRLKCESKTHELELLLHSLLDPIEFLCESLSLSPHCRDQVDNFLTTSLLANIPRHGLPLLSLPVDTRRPKNQQSHPADDRLASIGPQWRSQRSPSVTGRELGQYPTLLHFAAAHGLEQLTCALLDCPGAQTALEMRNESDLTPERIAVESGFYDLAEIIKSYKAEPSTFSHIYDYIRQGSLAEDDIHSLTSSSVRGPHQPVKEMADHHCVTNGRHSRAQSEGLEGRRNDGPMSTNAIMNNWQNHEIGAGKENSRFERKADIREPYQVPPPPRPVNTKPVPSGSTEQPQKISSYLDMSGSNSPHAVRGQAISQPGGGQGQTQHLQDITHLLHCLEQQMETRSRVLQQARLGVDRLVLHQAGINRLASEYQKEWDIICRSNNPPGDKDPLNMTFHAVPNVAAHQPAHQPFQRDRYGTMLASQARSYKYRKAAENCDSPQLEAPTFPAPKPPQTTSSNQMSSQATYANFNPAGQPFNQANSPSLGGFRGGDCAPSGAPEQARGPALTPLTSSRPQFSSTAANPTESSSSSSSEDEDDLGEDDVFGEVVVHPMDQRREKKSRHPALATTTTSSSSSPRLPSRLENGGVTGATSVPAPQKSTAEQPQQNMVDEANLAVTEELLHLLENFKRKKYTVKEMETAFEAWRRKAELISAGMSSFSSDGHSKDHGSNSPVLRSCINKTQRPPPSVNSGGDKNEKAAGATLKRLFTQGARDFLDNAISNGVIGTSSGPGKIPGQAANVGTSSPPLSSQRTLHHAGSPVYTTRRPTADLDENECELSIVDLPPTPAKPPTRDPKDFREEKALPTVTSARIPSHHSVQVSNVSSQILPLHRLSIESVGNSGSGAKSISTGHDGDGEQYSEPPSIYKEAPKPRPIAEVFPFSSKKNLEDGHCKRNKDDIQNHPSDHVEEVVYSTVQRENSKPAKLDHVPTVRHNFIGSGDNMDKKTVCQAKKSPTTAVKGLKQAMKLGEDSHSKGQQDTKSDNLYVVGKMAGPQLSNCLMRFRQSMTGPLLQYFHNVHMQSPDIEEPDVLNTPKSLCPPPVSGQAEVSNLSRNLFNSKEELVEAFARAAAAQAVVQQQQQKSASGGKSTKQTVSSNGGNSNCNGWGMFKLPETKKAKDQVSSSAKIKGLKTSKSMSQENDREARVEEVENIKKTEVKRTANAGEESTEIWARHPAKTSQVNEYVNISPTPSTDL